jgi:hypothetical protein
MAAPRSFWPPATPSRRTSLPGGRRAAPPEPPPLIIPPHGGHVFRRRYGGSRGVRRRPYARQRLLREGCVFDDFDGHARKFLAGELVGELVVVTGGRSAQRPTS